MKNKLLIFFISFLVIITILILFEFNTKYTIESKLTFKKSNNNGNLIVATHNYEHKDIFVMLNYFSKRSEEKYYVLFADKIWNIILEPLRALNLEFMYVTNGTVNKIINRLMAGDNVIMFLYNESDSNGIYHIMDYFDFNINVYLAKINQENINNGNTSNHYNSSFYDIFVNNFNKKFNLNFEEFENEKIIKNKDLFMNKFKKQLYS